MTEQDGSAIEQNVHRITIEFAEDGSSKFSMTGVSYMQVFSAAKFLEIQGESMYMDAQLAEQREAFVKASKKPQLVVPRPKGVS